MTLPFSLVILGAMALAGWAMYLHTLRPREVAQEVHEAKAHAEAARIAAQEANSRTSAQLAEALDVLSRRLTQAKDELAAMAKEQRAEVDEVAGRVISEINQLSAATGILRRDGKPFSGSTPPLPTAAEVKAVLR